MSEIPDFVPLIEQVGAYNDWLASGVGLLERHPLNVVVCEEYTLPDKGPYIVADDDGRLTLVTGDGEEQTNIGGRVGFSDEDIVDNRVGGVAGLLFLLYTYRDPAKHSQTLGWRALPDEVEYQIPVFMRPGSLWEGFFTQLNEESPALVRFS